MSEQNKATVRRYFEELWNEGDLDVAGDIIAPDYVNHDFASPEMRGPEGMKAHVSGIRSGFPDGQFTIEDLLVDGNKVVVRWTAQGTHTGEFNGIPPTNKQISVTGIDIHRMADGEIEETWSSWDKLSLMQQIGAVPAMEEA